MNILFAVKFLRVEVIIYTKIVTNIYIMVMVN